jgi:ribonuclease J
MSGGDDEYLLEDAASAVRHGLEKALSKGGKKRDLEKACRQSLQSVLWDRIKQRPLVIVNLLDI